MTQAAPRLLLVVLFPALNLPFPPVKFYAFEHFFLVLLLSLIAFAKVWHFVAGNQWAAMTQAAPRLLLFVLFPALNLPFPPVQLYVFEHFLVPAVLIACFKKFGILLMETSELLWPRQLPGFFFLYFPQPWTCPPLLFSSVSVWQLWEAH